MGTVTRSALYDVNWEWIGTTRAMDGLESEYPERYTILLDRDGKTITVRADCNRARGTYDLDGDRISIGPLGATRMMCPPGSQSDIFLRDLQGVATYLMRDGQLQLRLSDGGAVMRFRRGYAIPDPMRPQSGP